MFKIIVDFKSVNFNSIIDKMMSTMETMNSMGLMGGFKMPPFFSAAALKALPDAMKMDLIARAVETENRRISDATGQSLSPFLGDVYVDSVAVEKVKEENCILRLSIAVGRMDVDRALDMAAGRYLTDEIAGELLGTSYSPAAGREETLRLLKSGQEEERLFHCLKILSLSRERIIGELEKLASDRGMEIKISNLRLLMKKSN